MDGITAEDIGTTEEELREKQEETHEKTVDRLLGLMKAIDSAEGHGGDAIEALATAALYIIAATRNVKALREGVMQHMDDFAEKMPPKFLLAAMDSHRSFVHLEDALVSMFKDMIPQCLGGVSTNGTFVVLTAIGEATQRGGWAFGEVEENGKKG